MCLFTHFAAGALAGGATGNVWAGAVAGAASHAVLDAIPHYDHPSWKLELTGGVLSLVLLLLMPFFTVPALVGGIFGMAPDLENLFQKLGKMRRDQFIFPSHTGLIPHGRTLGARTLVWQVAIFVLCFAMLGVLAPGSASAAGQEYDSPVMGEPVIRVLASTPSVTRIQVQCPVQEQPTDWSSVSFEDVEWALPIYRVQDEEGNQEVGPPRLVLSVAVPTDGFVSAEVQGITWWKEPSAAVDGSQLVDFGKPALYRSVPLVGSEVPLGLQDGILRGLIIEIQHQPLGNFARQLQLALDEDENDKNAATLDRAPDGLLNPKVFSDLARGGRRLLLSEKSSGDRGEFNHFDLTTHWVRLTVDQNGLHQLTGQELSNMGISTSSVDPSKLRLFRGGSFQLETDPTIPDGEQPENVGLTEVAVQVLDGQDGEWNLDDEIRFYAYSTDFWTDRADPQAGHLEYYNHPFQDEGVYWLTWEDPTTASPIPGSPLRAAEVNTPSNGGEVVAIAKMRDHYEEQTFEAMGVVSDRWAWDTNILYTKTLGFNAFEPVADSLATYVLEFRGLGGSYNFTARGWMNDDIDHAVDTEFSGYSQIDSMRVRLVGQSSVLNQGQNQLSLESTNPERDYPLVFDSFDVFYWTALDLATIGGQMEFAHWRENVAVDGQLVDFQITVPTSGDVLLWDVSDSKEPRVLSGDLSSGQLTCGMTLDTDRDQHFLATTENRLHSVASGHRESPLALRSQPMDAHYIVVYAEEFEDAAENLSNFRSTSLLDIDSPVTLAVNVEDIYNNYSGGQKDLRAIRNYLKAVFVEGGGNLRFVCLLGNGTRDHRNYKGQNPAVDLMDLIPGEHRDSFPSPPIGYSKASYGSDDGLVSFDNPPTETGLDYPDVSVGRLPAMTVAEANGMVERMIDYAGNTESGLWRNHVLMVADDVHKPGSYWPDPHPGETVHTDQAEFLSNEVLPQSLDIQKIYGVAYEFPPGSGVKPQVRIDINAALNQGTTIFYYVGHGAEDNLADEQIFQSRDIPNLTNGMLRPLFVAFSCDVGVYDNPSRRSMAELFVTPENGGAIASICASQVSYIYPNEALSEAFFENLYPGGMVSATQSLGESLLLAKAAMPSNYMANSQRYNLLCDPAIRLPNPIDDLEFAADNIDTLRAGARQVVVLDDSGGLMLGAGDTYHLRVEESASDHFYIYRYLGEDRVPLWSSFKERGGAVFDGHGTMNSNELRVPFKVPVQLKYGDQARVRLVLDSLDGPHTAYLGLSSVRQATVPSDDVIGPSISLMFEDNRYRVKPGTILTAALGDTSSISILGTTPGNSILLEFDDSGFMTDVTESFSFEADSYQSGQLSFPLPGDLPLGNHLAALHASDVLGNVGNDTISFVIVPESVVGMDSITLFPNPTPGPCRLIFELSDPMQVKWDIYTLAGRRIKTMRDNLSGGQQIMHWDGRDDQGDEIANGTYIYVLRGTPTVGGEREITETGKLVIMQ